MKKVKSLRMKNELFYSLKKLKGILNYIIIITGDTVKCGVNIVIYATHTLIDQTKTREAHISTGARTKHNVANANL